MINRLDFYSQPHPKGTTQLPSRWVEVEEFLTGPGSGWSWCLPLCHSDETYAIFIPLKEAKGLVFPLQSNIRTQKTDKYISVKKNRSYMTLYSYHPKGFYVMLWILCGCSQ